MFRTKFLNPIFFFYNYLTRTPENYYYDLVNLVYVRLLLQDKKNNIFRFNLNKFKKNFANEFTFSNNLNFKLSYYVQFIVKNFIQFNIYVNIQESN